jgi:protein-tyrosine phosphatase
MTSVYREMPFLLAPAYSALLGAIAERTGPVVFGCTAGKDRTGFGAALLLSLLGAERQTVIADYRATNRFIDDLKRMVANDHQTDSDSERLLPVLMAEIVYLDASFEAIAHRCGSLQNYCTDILSVSDRQLARIRVNLLETQPI